ncbi:MAG TPA: hypothetical protein VMT52_03975, partial [Planctomycetota bacterium]|nr:hypothetical protein [Planctomycetota bacterium]
MARRMTRCVLTGSVYARTLISTCCLFLASPRAISQETPVIEPKLPDLAKVKEEEAREKLERLEDTMDRLAQAIAATEPQNAAKLKLAFRESRDRLLREGMDRVVKYLEEKKLDRAIAAQGDVRVNLEEILAILLERDIDPRELLKHIRRLRDIVKDLDQVVKEETSEKMASDEAHEAGPSAEAVSMDLQKLEDLIAREKKLEKGARDPENAAPAALGKLAPEQEAVRADTSKLREEDAA